MPAVIAGRSLIRLGIEGGDRRLALAAVSAVGIGGLV